jgi:hypothetical protein
MNLFAFRITLLFSAAAVLVHSCVSMKTSSGTSFDSSSGLSIIHFKGEHFSITYFADYTFNDFTKSQTLNWDRNFSKSIHSFRIKPILIYCGHTTMRPYCTSIGLFYKNSSRDSIIKVLKNDLKMNLPALNLTDTTYFIGINNVRVLTYDIVDQQFRVRNSYRDYYVEEKGSIFRITFWTRDADENWLTTESLPILESLRFDYSTIAQ